MAKQKSEFYPPRAWANPLLRRLWFAGLRKGVVRLAPEFDRAWTAKALWAVWALMWMIVLLLVPLYGFVAAGGRRIAKYALGLYGFSALAFLMFLGQAPAMFAGGLMVGAHGAGIGYFLNRKLRGNSRQRRMGVSAVAVLALFVFIYGTAFQLLSRVVFPLRTQDGVVVVNVFSSAESIQRGDFVGFRVPFGGGGYSFDRVQGVPGDVIRFRSGWFEVNGERHLSLAYMPWEGEIEVPEKHWFIWPESVRVLGDQGMASAALLQAALVPETRIIGKPFERWFWRRQIYEPVQQS